jgi:hypothetical protein
MASNMFDNIQLSGPALQPVRDAHEQLKSALVAARGNPEREAEELEEIEARLRWVVPGVVLPLERTLVAQHGEILGKLMDVQTAVGNVQTAVGNVAPAVVTPLDATLVAQHGEILGKLMDVQTAVGNVQTAVGNVAAAVVTPLAAQHGEILGKFAPLAEEMDELEGLLKGLPQQLAEVLLKNLPKIVRDVVVAIRTPIAEGPPVIVPVNFGSLDDLAKANAGDYTDTTAHRLGLLQGALDVIEPNSPVPPGLIPPIDNLIVTVLNFAPAKPLTIVELDAMNSLKNQISLYLQPPAVVGVK